MMNHLNGEENLNQMYVTEALPSVVTLCSLTLMYTILGVRLPWAYMLLTKAYIIM